MRGADGAERGGQFALHGVARGLRRGGDEGKDGPEHFVGLLHTYARPCAGHPRPASLTRGRRPGQARSRLGRYSLRGVRRDFRRFEKFSDSTLFVIDKQEQVEFPIFPPPRLPPIFVVRPFSAASIEGQIETPAPVLPLSSRRKCLRSNSLLSRHFGITLRASSATC